MDYPNLKLFNHFALDTETTGLDWHKDKIFGVSISTPDERDYYWDLREYPNTLLWLNDQLKYFKGFIVGHYFKYDLHMFREAGVTRLAKREPGFHWDCTLIRAALIDEHRFEYDLDSVAKDYIGLGKIDIYGELAQMFGGKPDRKNQMQNLYKAPSEFVAPYAKRDTRATLDLWRAQEKIINDVNMHKVCQLERDVMYVVQNMEQHGIRINVDLAERKVGDLTRVINREQNELNKLAGFKVNPNPSSDIHKLFKPYKDIHPVSGKEQWYASDGTWLSQTPKGKAQLDAEALRRMKHPAAGLILKIRKYTKCRDTFLKSQILSNNKNGYVYPNINQCKSDRGGTITGRLSITNPAVQTIPSRDIEISEIVRPVFLPDDDQKWYSADYSQADVRGFTHYTKSPPLLAAYEKDRKADFHRLVADMTGLPRKAPHSGGKNAKQLGLGLLFGMGEGKSAKEMNMEYFEEEINGKIVLTPGQEAIDMFINFHTRIPGVKEFLKKASAVAKSRGYIISLMGRHMHFPKGQFVYKAGAFLFQSATAEFNKVKMVDTYEIIKDTDSRLLLSVHDELNFSSNDPELMKEVEKEMEDFSSEKAKIKLRVPMVAEMKCGNNWFEAK